MPSISFKAPDIAIDLGSSNTMVYVRKHGLAISEPTLVVVNTENRHMVRAVGDEARYLLGRTRDTLTAISPIENGTITDVDAVAVLIGYFIRKAIGVNHLFPPRVLVSIPVGTPAVSRRAIYEAVRKNKCNKVYLVEKVLSAAIGSGLPIYDPVGSMVVDIGGGTTDAAIISLGGLVVSRSVPVGGSRMDEAIVSYLKNNSSMLIGTRMAEEIKIDLAAALPSRENRHVHVRGRDLLSAHAMDVEFTSAQAYEAVREPCMAILATIKWVLERTPPELAADIMRGGIHLTGGASQLLGLDQFIGQQTGIPVLLAKNPEDATVSGMGHILENEELLNEIMNSSLNRNK
ncbi:MAG: rod shape-determining protein [Clostridia bacterium]|nr:rod shape-determining protein [Clostridia bacterium]